MFLRTKKSVFFYCCLSVLLIVGVLCVVTPLSGQTIIQTSEQADSLRRVIAITKHDTTRINAMNELALYFCKDKNQFDSAMIPARAALEAAERSNYRVGIAIALNTIGLVTSKQGKKNEALQYYSKSLRISEERNDKVGIAASLELIGNVYMNMGRYSDAIGYFFKLLPMVEELGNKRNIARLFSAIAYMYTKLGKYADALEYDGKALHLFEKISHKSAIAAALSNIGTDYQDLRQYDKALEYQFKSLRINEELGNKNQVAECLSEIGVVYNCIGQYKQAQSYFFQALAINKASGRGERPNILNNIVISYRGQGKFDSALVFAFRSLALADSMGVPVFSKETLHELSVTLDSLGRHKESLAYFKRSMILKDSLINLENLNKTSQLKEGYEAEKREQQIALLNSEKALLTKDKALQESELIRQQAVLARAEAERQAQEQSILLLNNEKQVRNLTLQQQETDLAKARLREERDGAALKFSDAQNKLQQAEIAQSTDELARRRIIQWSLMGILAAAVAGALWLGALYRQKNKANKAILQQQAILEEQAIEIETANKELIIANTELDEANQMKTQVLSMAAHDLKNPLSIIIGYSEIALFDIPKDGNAEKYVQEIQSTAYKMNKLIGDLLDSAAMEMGNITLEYSDTVLALLVHTVSAQYEYAAQKKEQKIMVEADDSLVIQADTERLEQVFDNLVSNAVKYSPTGKTIWLRVFKTDGMARVEVQDEGPGMNEDDRQKLFGFFQRLSAQPTGGESSNGVGLAIVKKIVDLHRGKIWAESELGKGTTFIVELPISESVQSFV